MPGVPIAAIECAGASLNSEPIATRDVAWTLAGTSADPFSAAWAFAIQVHDHPPAWFEVPALDLQPEVTRAVHTALGSGVWSALSEGGSPETAIQRAFHRAREAFVEFRRGERATLFAGSAAVAAGVVATEDSATLGWIGRARVYRRRQGHLELLTTDHTALPAGTDAPELDKVMRQTLREVITRCIGCLGEGAQDFEVAATEIRAGDVFVVASAPRIEAALDKLSDPSLASASAHELACALVAAAASAYPGHSLGVAILRAKP